jgi:hypothetical protein
MTRAEYLEFVQEGLGFPGTGVGSPDPGRILYDSKEVVFNLRVAHQKYCNEVATLLDMPDQIRLDVKMEYDGKSYSTVLDPPFAGE